jgi:hypothetical protein
MRPPSVYANPACSAGCGCDVTRLLQGRHRVALRLVMILLSCKRWPPVAIAELLGCDVATCGAGSTATTPTASPACTTGPAQAGLDWAAHGWVRGWDGCLSSPRPGRCRGFGPARPRDHEPADPPPTGR